MLDNNIPISPAASLFAAQEVSILSSFTEILEASQVVTSSKWEFSSLLISPYSSHTSVQRIIPGFYLIGGIDQIVWVSFSVGVSGFVDRCKLDMTSLLVEIFRGEGDYIHVPVYLIVICVANTFRFKVAEEVDDAFYSFLNISIFHEMFDAVTSFTRSDEDHIRSIRKSTKSDSLFNEEYLLNIIIPNVKTSRFCVLY